MENVTRKNQLYFDFGRDYDASLENFFFSSKNQVLKNELSEVIQSDQKKDIFISGTSGSGKTFLLNSLLNQCYKLAVQVGVYSFQTKNYGLKVEKRRVKGNGFVRLLF